MQLTQYNFPPKYKTMSVSTQRTRDGWKPVLGSSQDACQLNVTVSIQSGTSIIAWRARERLEDMNSVFPKENNKQQSVPAEKLFHICLSLAYMK